MYKRKILNEIYKWKDSLKIKRRALVIKGLRQIGKTTVEKHYCESNYKSVIYINFMDNKSLKKIFDADLIVVLDNGVVVESGNHNELLEENGVYKNLYETQFKGLNT